MGRLFHQSTGKLISDNTFSKKTCYVFDKRKLAENSQQKSEN